MKSLSNDSLGDSESFIIAGVLINFFAFILTAQNIYKYNFIHVYNFKKAYKDSIK